MTAYAHRIEPEFKREISRPHHLIGETFHALSIADETDHLLDEFGCYPRPEVPANDADLCCRTVLVVEDDEPLRVTVSDALRGFGFEVEEAAMVGDAKRLLAIIPPSTSCSATSDCPTGTVSSWPTGAGKSDLTSRFC